MLCVRLCSFQLCLLSVPTHIDTVVSHGLILSFRIPFYSLFFVFISLSLSQKSAHAHKTFISCSESIFFHAQDVFLLKLMALFKCHLAKGRLVDGAEIVVKIFIIASNANHGCVVGGVAELRNVNCPTILLCMFMESVAQTVVCRHAASHSHMLDACLLDSLTKLVHKNVDDGKLKTGCSLAEATLRSLR